MGFSPGLIDRLRGIDQVRIETRAAPAAPVHRTIIWIVVDGADRVLIRTYRGPDSRWYREARAQPEAVLWVGSESVAVRVEAATDPDRVAAASRGYEAKYAGDSALPAMLVDAVLPTTLELKRR